MCPNAETGSGVVHFSSLSLLPCSFVQLILTRLFIETCHAGWYDFRFLGAEQNNRAQHVSLANSQYVDC